MTYAQVAELVDAHVSGACVERHAGSSPVLGTLLLKKGESSHAEIAQLVEHNLAKVRVASSSLVFRSFYNKQEIPVSIRLRGFFCFIFWFSAIGEGSFLFQGEAEHHAVVIVCKRTDRFQGGAVAFTGNQGYQF